MAKAVHTTVAPQFDKRAIMKAAWTGYRKMAREMRETAFNPQRFVFELQLAWRTARREAERKVLAAAPAVLVPEVMKKPEGRRAEEIRNELLWLEMGERIDWARHRELSIELFQARA